MACDHDAAYLSYCFRRGQIINKCLFMAPTCAVIKDLPPEDPEASFCRSVVNFDAHTYCAVLKRIMTVLAYAKRASLKQL